MRAVSAHQLSRTFQAGDDWCPGAEQWPQCSFYFAAKALSVDYRDQWVTCQDLQVRMMIVHADRATMLMLDNVRGCDWSACATYQGRCP